MDTNITVFIKERRLEMVFFPVVVFGYLTSTTGSNTYMILTIFLSIASPIAYHLVYRMYGSLDPTGTDSQQKYIALQSGLPESRLKLFILSAILLPYMIILSVGIPVALYLNLNINDVVIIGFVVIYVIFMVSSQGHRLFNSGTSYTQVELFNFIDE